MGYSPNKDWKPGEEQEFLKKDFEETGDNYRIFCVVCGKEFYCRRPEGKYCSYRCRNDAYIQRRREIKQIEKEKTCVVCGIFFLAKRKDTLYCSPKCKQKKFRERVTDKSCAYLSRTNNRNVVKIDGGKLSTTQNSNVLGVIK